MTQCKLCLREAILRKSHVLPELVYRPVYDPDSRCLRVDMQQAGVASLKAAGTNRCFVTIVKLSSSV